MRVSRSGEATLLLTVIHCLLYFDVIFDFFIVRNKLGTFTLVLTARRYVGAVYAVCVCVCVCVCLSRVGVLSKWLKWDHMGIAPYNGLETPIVFRRQRP